MENFHEYESAARKKFENIGSVTVDGAYRFFEGLRNLSPSKADMEAAAKRAKVRPFKDSAPMNASRGELRLTTGDVIAIAIELDKITQERLSAAAQRHDAERLAGYDAADRAFARREASAAALAREELVREKLEGARR